MENENDSPLMESIDGNVIKADTNVFRFERFCIAAISETEGQAAVVGTSTTWDRGRDGVGLGRASGIYLCASLRDDVDVKCIEDLERIKSTTKSIRKLYFCSSQPLTENSIDKIENALRRELDNSTEVKAVGSTQLAQLGRRHPGLIEKFYGAEIRSVLDAIQKPADAEIERSGLRLALISTAPSEAHEIRKEVYANAILDVLADRSPRTVQKLAIDISSSLRLHRPVNTTAIHPYLSQLERDGLVVAVQRGVYEATEIGLGEIQQKENDAAIRLLQGRNALKAAIEEAIGAEIITDEFNRMWEIFESRMTDYFSVRGEAIVSEIAAALGEAAESEPPTGEKSQLTFLDELAKSVSEASSHAQRRAEVALAIKDIFSDRSSDAAKWLARVCAAFIAACAMGLEHTSAEAIKSLVRKTTIALDSDAVLSLLCEGEPDHEAIAQVVQRWRECGGKVVVASTVLMECAYHAHIADRDYEQVKHLIPGSIHDRAYLIENAFVRAFAQISEQNPAAKGRWRNYISEFRGRNEHDYQRLFGHLASEHGITQLPDRLVTDAGRVADVNSYLLDSIEREGLRVDKSVRDKASRDSELYVSLVRHLLTLKESDPDASCLLVSSAHRLLNIDRVFQQSGEQQLVITIGTALYLISLLPDTRLGLSSLKAFLFDGSRNRFSSDLERTILRMVKSSSEYSVPWAKRGMLFRSVKEHLIKNAAHRERGSAKATIAELEAAAVTPTGRAGFIEALSAALDEVSADTAKEKRIRDLVAENERLRAELERRKK